MKADFGLPFELESRWAAASESESVSDDGTCNRGIAVARCPARDCPKKGYRRSTLAVGLHRTRRGSARVFALGLGQAVTVNWQSQSGRSLLMSAESSSSLVRPGRTSRKRCRLGRHRPSLSALPGRQTVVSIVRIRCA